MLLRKQIDIKLTGMHMTAKIKNLEQLLTSGDGESRRIVLDVAERILRKLDAYHRIRSMMSLQGDILSIGSRSWDLSTKRHVYLIGAGKACNAMALAVEEILGDRLTDGVAIVKIKEPADNAFRRTRVYVGGHPLPNQAGLAASEKVLALIDGANQHDLFLCVMSGGSSALMSYPMPGISLQDEIDATDVLLKSGAAIREINAVRRHISRMNGGRMAQKIADKGAELIGFNISDSVSNPPTGDVTVPWPDFQATPMGPDHTTLDDARQTIQKYNLRHQLPASVVDFFDHCTEADETPKAFPQNTYYQINTLPDSCVYGEQAAAELNLPCLVLTTFLEGEAKDIGTIMAAVAREIQGYRRPIAPPCLVLSAGEAVTTIIDNSTIKGHGGPSQEMTLSFALSAGKAPGVCLLSIDSEGTDGTTDAAGGITDSASGAAAIAADVDIAAALRNHASYEALRAINSIVLTGNTGTNVCDINIMFVPALQ